MDGSELIGDQRSMPLVNLDMAGVKGSNPLRPTNYADSLPKLVHHISHGVDALGEAG